jgi:DNA-binding NtrC family response regulator
MKRKARILIFEDEPTIRLLFETVLKMRGGYEVLSFEDPSDSPLSKITACDCLGDKVCADIVITDINMPTVNGLDFLENQYNSCCKINMTNVAIMSGYWTDECLERAERMEAVVLEKPFTIDVIDSFLDKCEEKIEYEKDLMDKSFVSNDL